MAIKTGQEDHTQYSSIILTDKKSFECFDKKDAFQNITKVICSFDMAPIKKFGNVDNAFFKIDVFEKLQRFYLKITPKHKLYIKPIFNDLALETVIETVKNRASDRWLIIGYKDKVPFLEPTFLKDSSISFPIDIPLDKLPHIGPLDISGNPIKFIKTGDVNAFLNVKQYFKEEKYDLVLEQIHDVFTEYPETIFKADLLLYKIRTLYEKQDRTEVIAEAKSFIREYSSNENMPEVLMMIAHAYSKVGSVSDANYYFERLISEYEDSPFAQESLIYIGDQYNDSGDRNRAKEYYEKALYSTKDLGIASKAAHRLGRDYLAEGKTKQAKHFYNKILDANPGYFLQDRAVAMENAQLLTERELFSEAVRIAEIVFDNTKKIEDSYEGILKNLAIWQDEAGNKEEAFNLYEEYLKEFEYGEYSELIRKRKATLFFKVEDKNSSEQIDIFDDVIKKYSDDEIASIALIKKAKTFYKDKQFADVLALTTQLKAVGSDEALEVLQKSATAYVTTLTKDGNCVDAISIAKSYEVSVEQSVLEPLAACTLRQGMYDEGLKISTEALEKDQSPKTRLFWLYMHAQLLFKKGEYSDAIEVANDVLSLSEVEELQTYDDIMYVLFDAYKMKANIEAMVVLMKRIEKRFGDIFKHAKMYETLARNAYKEKDSLMVENYAKRVVALQKRAKSYPYTPAIEFLYVQALKQRKAHKEIITILDHAKKVEMKKSEKARLNYLLGSAYTKTEQKSEAKKAFEASLKADPSSAWGSLSKDAIGLLK
jgi:tetratricopeptide (TPR) repeat protein